MQAQDILAFWFADGMNERWFRATPALDAEIRARFEDSWAAAAGGELDAWADSPDGALALAIVLDQFPLNMFRGEARAFATESRAVEVVLEAVAHGLDRRIDRERLAFLYMPLMHSEDPAHQDLAVHLFEQAGLASNARFARHHREIIRRFGRFPHRNAVLDRESTLAEIAYLSSDEAFKG